MRSCLLLLCFWATLGLGATPTSLHIATWNLEWLVSTETSHRARRACDAGKRAAMPCNAAHSLARDSADWARLAAHARRVNADIFAFQEVENEQAAQRVFKGYEICMPKGGSLQKTGFAIRPGLGFTCLGAYEALSIGGRERPGTAADLHLGPRGSLRLLSIHLKSGCADEALDSSRSNCRRLRAQAAALQDWIQTQAAANQTFVLLGDFNRRGPREDDAFWQQLLLAAPDRLRPMGVDVAYANCVFGQPYAAAVDHIFLSQGELALRADDFRRWTYHSRDSARYKMSDHCPQSVRLRLGPS
jgi:endonuclease/exonuclease/phosphatase family metal-dependent hydrolase